MSSLDNLTTKQRAFVLEYIHCFNATQAAIAAGYSENSAAVIGSQNLRKLNISAAIEEYLNENAMSAAEVLWHLTNIARGDIADVVNMSGALSMPQAIEARKSNLIKKVKSKTTYFGGKKESDDGETHEEEVEMYDRLKALELLAKYHDLINKVRVEVDWKQEAVTAIAKGKLPFEILADEVGYDLAEELFESAGVPAVHAGQDTEGTT